MNDEILMQSLLTLMKTMNGLSESQSAIAQSLNSINEKLSTKQVFGIQKNNLLFDKDVKDISKEIKKYDDPVLQELQELISKPFVIPDNVSIVESVPSTHYVPKFTNINKKTLLPNSSTQSGDFVGFGEVK